MIVVGTTLAAFVMDKPETWSSWLTHHDQIKESHGNDVRYFAAIELDGRGIEPFLPLVEELDQLGATYFTYSLDDGRTEVTTSNRLRHIVTGRNIVTDFAVEHDASHILYLDADLAPPADTLPKLLEMDHPIVGGNVGAYALGGPRVDKYPFPVEQHWNTAGFLLVQQCVYNRIRWRWELYMTDDPCYARDVKDFLGYDTYVRKDIQGLHWPRFVSPLEMRPHDRTVVR
jgi:hypothetical protein